MTNSQRLLHSDSEHQTDLAAVIGQFGGELHNLHLLDDAGPELLPYATLLTARQSDGNVLSLVRAVYEWQDAPLLYLVPEEAVQNDEQLERIRRLLAMRGDAPYLGVVGAGRLEVYLIALDSKNLSRAKVNLAGTGSAQQMILARLSNQRPQAQLNHKNWISSVLLKLLSTSIDSIIASEKITHEDAISLIGRALFVRFLGDRNLLPATLVTSEGDAALFDRPEIAQATSTWLDHTFNGDFLPLSKGIFQQLTPAAYTTLGHVLRRAPEGQQMLGWEIKWANLDFAHIPVGVLSQAYELYLREHAPAKQKKEGGYYTPRPIADLMVRASFRALERQENAHKAKVLDPAAGAGVFLLTAFRELVAEHWHITGKRPTTSVLRSILYNQIVGFDINESALRFAALALYLMSVELDPHPVPVDKLRFEDLRGKVLHLVSDVEAPANQQLGSLGPQVGAEHVGQYDLVIGNPPWASSTGLENWDVVEETVARISATRRKEHGVFEAVTSARMGDRDAEVDDGPIETTNSGREQAKNKDTPPLPNEVLDLPFVWRAMEWAKPNGQIAFALHARLLFQQGDGMPKARQAIFEALDVTSVINGVELRRTKVWPEITAPFCILFANNRSSYKSVGFRLVTPRIDESLNNAGGMRIDTANSEIISFHQISTIPDIIKILSSGGKADLALLMRIWGKNYPTLRDYWKKVIGERDRKNLLGSGAGYQSLRPSSRIRKAKKPGSEQLIDELPGVSAKYLWDMDEVTPEDFDTTYTIPVISRKFREERIHDRRHESIFQAPLIIVHKSPSTQKRRIGVILRNTDTVYSSIFYGYSTKRYSTDPKKSSEFAAYLAAIFGSKFALWYVLVISGSFGVERDVLEKITLDSVPIPKFEEVESGIIDELLNLMTPTKVSRDAWDRIDKWVARLYELTERDLQIIDDTLEFNLPFAENRRIAQMIPEKVEQDKFCQELLEELTPWSKRMGANITVRPFIGNQFSPWFGVVVQNTAYPISQHPSPNDWEGLVRAADATASTELIIRVGDGNLLIGRLAQRRYWSVTEARLLAQRIVSSHLDLFRQRVLS